MINNSEKFFELVYSAVEKIPSGYVMTYGQIAALIGYSGRARHVGHALSIVTQDRRLPCHRVVNSQGAMLPAHVFGEGVQRRLLENEGLEFTSAGRVNMKKHLLII